MAKIHVQPRKGDRDPYHDDEDDLRASNAYTSATRTTHHSAQATVRSNVMRTSTDADEYLKDGFISDDRDDDSQDDSRVKRTGCGHQFVLYDSDRRRRVWNCILFVLLIYTGTVFPFRLCFVEFKIPEAGTSSVGWEVIGWIVDIFFWFDLIINFFFTYTDESGAEVDRLSLIAKKYLRTFFTLNLIACLPPDAFEPLFHFLFDSANDDANVNKLTRMARLQRTTRLARLARLVRLARLAKMVTFLVNSPTMRWLSGLRGMRVVNFVVFLFWIVHILACGWYLCAALHEDWTETWVNRRAVSLDGTPLIERGSAEQWLHSMYFVFTIFTTVGFGDISAITCGEIVYCMATMLMGAVVHSIIVSEMINVVTFIDTTQIEVTRIKEILDGFARHTQLSPKMKDQLKTWVDCQAKTGQLSNRFDKEAMREMLTNGVLPATIVRELPDCVYGGRLQRNKFLLCCYTHTAELPPRASILISLALIPRSFLDGEVVYQMHDHPFNIFLVDGASGIFAYVGKAGERGGVDEVPMGSKPSNPSALSAARAIGLMQRLSEREKEKEGGGGSTPLVSRMSLSKRQLSKLSQSQALYPYQLFCDRSYFGDLELLQSGSRRSTARCEQRGQLLVLHKQDLWHLMEDFPHFGNAWRAAARCREMKRRDCIAALRQTLDFKAFAATRIQRSYRDHLKQVNPEERSSTLSLRRRASFHKRKTKGELDKHPPVGKPGLQTEIDIAGPSQASGSRSMGDFQAEMRQEMRNGLQQIQQGMLSLLLEMRGETRDTQPLLSSRKTTSVHFRRNNRATTVALLEDDKTSAAPIDHREFGEEMVSGSSDAEAENRRLRALVTEQQRHMQHLQDLVTSGGSSNNARGTSLLSVEPSASSTSNFMASDSISSLQQAAVGRGQSKNVTGSLNSAQTQSKNVTGSLNPAQTVDAWTPKDCLWGPQSGHAAPSAKAHGKAYPKSHHGSINSGGSPRSGKSTHSSERSDW